MTTATATPNQLGLIQKLVDERKTTCSVPDVVAFVEALRTERITKTGASSLIDKLIKTPADPTPGAPQRNGQPENRFGGECVLCGNQVGPREGTYRRGNRGWETLHLPSDPACVRSAAPAIVAADSKTESSWDAVEKALHEFGPGYYAIPSVTGTNDLTFFRIGENQGRVNPANKGKLRFHHVVGGHDDGELRVSPAFVFKALEVLRIVGVRKAQQSYGQHIGSCGKCGRTLTDEVSRSLGIGPDCRSKAGW